MPLTEYETVRAQAHRLLAESTTVLTASSIADQIGTTPAQTARALRQLEARGLAVRQHGTGAQPGGGRAPDRWSAVLSGRSPEGAR